MHVLTASVGGGERDTLFTHAVQVQPGGSEKFKSDLPSTSIYRQLLMVLFLLYDIEKSYVNAGMSEYRRKVSPTSAFLPVDSCLSPASVFRHKGSVRYRWSRIIPALPRPGRLIRIQISVICYKNI
jgi:hypothetical protein